MNIEDLIKEKIESIDLESEVERCTKEVVREIVESNFKQTIKDHISTYTSGIIKAECDAILNGPVDLCDGWDKKESFESFELLFKARLRKALSGNNWDIKRHVNKIIDEKLSSLVIGAQKEIAEAVANNVIANAAKLGS
jgi:histone H3/H4